MLKGYHTTNVKEVKITMSEKDFMLLKALHKYRTDDDWRSFQKNLDAIEKKYVDEDKTTHSVKTNQLKFMQFDLAIKAIRKYSVEKNWKNFKRNIEWIENACRN